MDLKKRKRLLGFEQLDARIAMNADMPPFLHMDHNAVANRLENRMLESGNEFQNHRLNFAVSAQSQEKPIVTKMVFVPHGREALPFKIPAEMSASAGGEYSKAQNSIAQNLKSSPSARTNSTSSSVATPSFAIAILFRPVVNVFQSGKLPVFVDSISDGPSSANASTSENPIASNLTTSNTSSSVSALTAQLLRRDNGIVAKSIPLASAPLVGFPIPDSASASNTGTSRSVLQNDATTTGAFKPSSSLSIPKELTGSVNNMASSKRLESMKPTENGMFEFSLRNPNDASAKTERARTGGNIGNNTSMNSNDQAILAEIDRMASNPRRLPAPKGMIEIGDMAEVTRQPAVVYKASNSPFEIIQLVLGTNNNAGSRETSDRTDEESSSAELSDLATREESILALAIGTLFAIAIRKRSKSKSPFHLASSARSNSL